MKDFAFPGRTFGPWTWFFAPLLACLGCSPELPPESLPASQGPASPLRLLVIGDPGLAKVIQREWNARSDGELKLREMSEEEFAKSEQRRLAADAVVYPSSLVGELAGRQWLAPLPKERLDAPEFQLRDIFAATRKQEMRWEEETIAVSLGGPPLLLFYRRDIFDHLALQPPRTWAEYRELSERLSQRELVKSFLASSEATWSGTCEPGKELWRAQLLLARAAAYSKHRSQFSALFDYRTMKPLIAGPPYVRALQEMAAAAQFGPATSGELAPADAVSWIRDGKCAMAIGWLADATDRASASATETESTSNNNKSPRTLGVIPLPGSPDVYNFRSEHWEQRGADESWHVPFVGISGRLGSLTHECRQTAAAVRLLLWLAGPEMGTQISASSSSTGPFRQSQLPLANTWTGNRLPPETVSQFAEALRQSLEAPNCLIGLRVPGHQQYLESLAGAIRASLKGEETAEASLTRVSKKWQEITDSIGLDQQRNAYAQSIGLRPL